MSKNNMPRGLFDEPEKVIIESNPEKDNWVKEAYYNSKLSQDEKQVIHGTIPSKSNCYIIITFRAKPPKKSHPSLAKTKALKQYEKDFFIQCNKYRNANIDSYFSIEVDVYYPNQRSDLDNSLKVLMDCLQTVKAIENDNKCVRIVANKFLDKNNPRIEFTLKRM